MACFAAPEPKRPKFDRSMIGKPTDFKHTNHFGRDTDATALDSLGGKGGYVDGGLTEEEKAMLGDMTVIDIQEAQDRHAASLEVEKEKASGEDAENGADTADTGEAHVEEATASPVVDAETTKVSPVTETEENATAVPEQEVEAVVAEEESKQETESAAEAPATNEE